MPATRSSASIVGRRTASSTGSASTRARAPCSSTRSRGTTGFATPIGTTGTSSPRTASRRLPVGAGAATVFGIDFNPTVDRVRVVNSAGQNFRMNPNNGAFVDGNAMAANLQHGRRDQWPDHRRPGNRVHQQRAERDADHAVHAGSDHRRAVHPEPAEQRHADASASRCALARGLRARLRHPPGVDTATANAPAAAGWRVVQLAGQTGDGASANLDLTNWRARHDRRPIGTGGIIGLALQQSGRRRRWSRCRPTALQFCALLECGARSPRRRSRSPASRPARRSSASTTGRRPASSSAWRVE